MSIIPNYQWYIFLYLQISNHIFNNCNNMVEAGITLYDKVNGKSTFLEKPTLFFQDDRGKNVVRSNC